jgi:hypothetical protein
MAYPGGSPTRRTKATTSDLLLASPALFLPRLSTLISMSLNCDIDISPHRHLHDLKWNTFNYVVPALYAYDINLYADVLRGWISAAVVLFVLGCWKLIVAGSIDGALLFRAATASGSARRSIVA